MGFFETAQEKKERTVREIKNRITRELRNNNNKTFTDVYNKEMQNLYTLVEDITVPPSYVWKKDTYRSKKNQTLGNMIEGYKKFFGDKIDDKLRDAEEFHKAINNADTVEKRTRLFTGIKPYWVQSKTAGKEQSYIHQLNRTPLESPFKVRDDVSVQFQNMESEYESNKLKIIEKEVHETIKKAMDGFNPEEIFKDEEKPAGDAAAASVQEQWASGNVVKYWQKLKTILEKDKANYEDKDFQTIRELVKTLNLNNNTNSPIKNILWKKGDSGLENSGLDFMVECYPNILLDTLLHKVLTLMGNRALVFLKNGADLSSFNSQAYVTLLAQNSALSLTMTNEEVLFGELMIQYDEFRSKKASASTKAKSSKTENKPEEKTGASARTEVKSRKTENKPEEKAKDLEKKEELQDRIAKVLKGGLYSKDQATDKRFKGLHAIVDRLEKYTTFDKKDSRDIYSNDGYIQKRYENAWHVLKDWGTYYVEMKDLEDFFYIVNSEMGPIIRQETYKNVPNSFAAMSYALTVCPEVFKNCMAYVLLRQLEQEVGKLKMQDIPGFEQKKYEELLKEKTDLEPVIKDGKNIMHVVRRGHDDRMETISEGIPEYFPNYSMWNRLVFAQNKNPDCPKMISDDDFHAWDTNDIQKLDQLVKDYGDKDKLLKKHVEFRKNVIQKVNKIENRGPIRRPLKGKRHVNYSPKGYRLPGIQGEKQFTSNGCWSVVLSQMLKWEGMDHLSQSEIRAYRAVPSYKNVDHANYKEGFDQNMGYPSNIGCHMNLISKLLPNTAMHRVRFSTWKAKPEDVKERLKEIIRDVVERNNKPLAIEIGHHYRLISGLEENSGIVEYYDPLSKGVQASKLDDFVSVIMNSSERAADIYWFSDIDITNDKPNFQIDRTLGSKNDRKGQINYDSDGKLHNMILDDKNGKLRELEEYVENEKDSNVVMDEIDSEYVHENYEVFYVNSKTDFEGDMIYLPKKLRLKKNDKMQKNEKLQKNKLSDQETGRLMEKANETYNKLMTFWNGQERTELFSKDETLVFNDACESHFKLISLYFDGQISLTDEMLDRLDSQMSEIFKAMRYATVDSNQSNTFTTKFFNAIGWSSNKPTICKDMNEELKKNNDYPVKMFHTIAPNIAIQMKEMVKQLVGIGEHVQQFYNSKRAVFGEGLYTAAANMDKELKDDDEKTAIETSWNFGHAPGSVQFTMALNENAKVIDNDEISDVLLDIEKEFPETFEVSKGIIEGRKKFQNIFLAFKGYNVNRVKNPDHLDTIDYYCITDRKAISIDHEIKVRVENMKDVNDQNLSTETKKLDEFVA